MNETHIKVYGTDIEFTIQGNPTYPDILSFARQNKIRLPDQPIFSTTRPPNPDILGSIYRRQRSDNK